MSTQRERYDISFKCPGCCVCRGSVADPDVDRMMTLKEIADFFSVTVHTVRIWVLGTDTTRPAMRAGKVNGSWRVLKSEVLRYAQETYGSNQNA